jgi:hypothetical protein
VGVSRPANSVCLGQFCVLLRAGDVESALQYFVEGDSRESYSEVFRNMGDAVRQTPESWSEIEMIDEFGNFARYVLIRTKDGERRMHERVFAQDQDGKWFLSSLCGLRSPRMMCNVCRPPNNRLRRTVVDKVPRHWRQRAAVEPGR